MVEDRDIYPPPPLDDPEVWAEVKKIENLLDRTKEFVCLRCINSGMDPEESVYQIERFGPQCESLINHQTICDHCSEVEEDFLQEKLEEIGMGPLYDYRVPGDFLSGLYIDEKKITSLLSKIKNQI